MARITVLAMAIVVLIVSIACNKGRVVSKDESDTGTDLDTDSDTDIDADTDTDTDTDSDTSALPVECAILDPDAYGDCEMILGWGFVGVGCIEIGGCDCEPDCDYFFTSVEECEASCDCQGLGGHCQQLDGGDCAVCDEGYLVHALDGDCPDETWCCIPPQGPPTQCSDAGGVCARVSAIEIFCPPGWTFVNLMCLESLLLDCCMQYCP